MAEAHQAINVFEEHKRGIELLYSDEGIRISFTIPPPWQLRNLCLRHFFHMQRAITRRVYPAPPLAAVLLIIAVIFKVLYSSPTSWWRTSSLSYLIWNIGEYLIPFKQFIPPTLYLAYLSAWAAFIGLLILMYIHRMILRILLSYRKWLYLAPREKSNLVLIWGLLLKILGGTNPLTYSFQDALPRLPVPPLKETIQRYLKSVHPLLNEEEYKETQEMADLFLKNEGPKLQWYLILKSWWATNYVTDWWEQFVYLKGRSSLMINSNYYALPPRNFEFRLSTNPNAVSAVLIRLLMIFKQDLDRELLPPMLIRGIVPLCMKQYERMFSTTRIPGREIDVLKHYTTNSRHVAVLCKGRWFKLPLFELGQHGRLLSYFEIERQLNTIQEMATSLGPPSASETHLSSLTAVGRIEWAETREKYFSEGRNKINLEIIESSIFILILQDNIVSNSTEMGHDLIHGNGFNRWFDKSFQLIVYKNGLFGFNAEHAWADAPAMAHVWEYVCCQQVILNPFQENGHTKITLKSEETSKLPSCKLLSWEFTSGLTETIEKSVSLALDAISDIDLDVVAFEDYGKGLIKTFNVSPDGFVQMALQLAYYRNQGTITQTYESSMTRLYRDGRTETVRPVTDESKSFVLAMGKTEVSREEKLKLLQTACTVHQEGYRNAMSGKGIDRHLFTLYCVSVGFGIESPFLKNALGRPWRLSTSQQPQQQTNLWPLVEKAIEGTKWTINDCLCLGGGFGPVAEDGYGVSYMIAGEKLIGFHISSKISCKSTSSKQFAKDLFQALMDMKELISK